MLIDCREVRKKRIALSDAVRGQYAFLRTGVSFGEKISGLI